MVLLRTVSRTIYVFTLIALILIWIPAVTHVDRLPFVIALGTVAVLTAACFAWMVLRLPREGRLMVRRTLRAPRVAAALALALGGVAVAFGLVAFTPATDLTQVLPVAVVITVAARLAAFAALRGAVRKHLAACPPARPAPPRKRRGPTAASAPPRCSAGRTPRAFCWPSVARCDRTGVAGCRPDGAVSVSLGRCTRTTVHG